MFGHLLFFSLSKKKEEEAPKQLTARAAEMKFERPVSGTSVSCSLAIRFTLAPPFARF